MEGCGLMALSLGLLALALCLTYSIYFYQIIRGQADEFERELLQAFAAWMMERGPTVKRLIWVLILITALVELGYFILVFMVISNQAMQYITAFFAGLECFHALLTVVNFRHFFAGHTKVGQVFNWRMERISGLCFFTHTLLVMSILVFF